MKRSFSIVLTILLLNACSTIYKVKIKEHPVHGDATFYDDIYQTDYQYCIEKVYAEGVNVNGVKSTNIGEITNFSFELQKWLSTTPSNQEIPGKYNDVITAGNKITSCIKEKGWITTAKVKIISKKEFRKLEESLSNNSDVKYTIELPK